LREPNKWEQLLTELLVEITGFAPLQEYKFHPTRKWRFDAAYPSIKLAFEVEGGTWAGGRHVNPVGFEKDCEKYNEAARLGWKVFRLTPKMIKEDYLQELIIKEVTV
jgi:hypothetical protein